jgi:hypothetical protein
VVVRVPRGWKLAREQAVTLVRDDDRPFALVGCRAAGGARRGSGLVTPVVRRAVARLPA